MSAFVQSKSATGTSGAFSVTLNSTPTQGNLLVCVCSSAGQLTIAMSSSGWTPLTNSNAGGGTSRSIRMFYKIAGAGESSTVTTTTTSSAWFIAVAEYSGINTATPLNVENSQVNASGATQPTPTVTPSGSEAILIVCGSGVRNNADSFSNQQVNSSTTGVTEREDNTSSGNQTGCLYDKFVGSASGSYSGVATPTTTAVGEGAIAIFNDAVAASTDMKWNRDTNQPIFDKIGIISYFRSLIKFLARHVSFN